MWWAGTEEYYDCTIKDWHVAVGEHGQLFYTHRCEYDGGTFDHDLSKASFEVIEVAACNTQRRLAGTPREQEGAGLKRTALNGMTPVMSLNYAPLSPHRKWLMQQEKALADFEEDLE